MLASGLVLLFVLLFLPVAGHAQTTTFVVLTDLRKIAEDTTPAVFPTAASHSPDRVLWLGDRDHRFGAGAMPTRAMIQALHADVAAQPGWIASGLAALPQDDTWSDHDSLADNVNRTHPGWPIAIEEHQLAYPAPYASAAGLWYTRVHGPVRIVVLDTRSNRDPLGTPGASMLGVAQENWLQGVLMAATEPYIVVMMDSPLAPGAKPMDAWTGWPIAQAVMELTLTAHCQGRCVLLSGDQHINAARVTVWGVEINVPHANLPNSIKVWGSCGNTEPTNCGAWDWMMQGRGRPGFAVLRVTPTSLTAEVRGAVNNNVRWSVTVP